jgi:tetratricopeptide (TPR) repeat protein
MYLSNDTIMKHLLFFICVLGFLMPQLAQAQCGQLDSLYRILRVAKKDVDKVNTLNALADELVNFGRAGQATFYTKQALRIAENAGYDKGIADALTRVALLDYDDLDKLSKSVADFEKALSIYEELGDEEQMVKTLGVIANFHYKALDEGSHRKALEYYKQVAALQNKLEHKKEEAEAYEAMGTLYGRLYQDPEALKAYEQAHTIKLKLGIATPTNERLLAKYQRLNELESHIQSSNTVRLATGFGIAIAVLLILLLTFLVQRNRALQLIKEHNPELLAKKPQSASAHSA